MYKKYLDILVEICKSEGQGVEDLKLVTVGCLLSMLENLSHFNFSGMVAERVTLSLLSKDERVRNLVGNKLKLILGNRAHSLYDIKETILKEMGRLLNGKNE